MTRHNIRYKFYNIIIFILSLGMLSAGSYSLPKIPMYHIQSGTDEYVCSRCGDADHRKKYQCNGCYCTQCGNYTITQKNISFLKGNEFFKKVSNKNDAFFQLDIKEESSWTGLSTLSRLCLSALFTYGSYKFGESLVDDEGSDIEDDDYLDDEKVASGAIMAYLLGGSLTGGLTVGTDDFGPAETKFQTEYTLSLLNHSGRQIKSSTVKVVEGHRIYSPWAAFLAFGGTIIYGVGPAIGFLAGWGIDFDAFGDVTYKTIAIKPSQIEDFLSTSNNQFSNYMVLKNLVDQYNTNIDLSEINKWKSELSAPYGKPKGEFETSNEYSKRQSEEAILLNSIKEKYRTRVNKKKEEFNQKKSELSAAINKAKKKVTLSRSCSFSFSKYDADTEKFRLTIERKGSSSTKVGYISIPRRDAPKFKKELKKSHVIQLVSPTLSGNWEPVNSNFVLVTSNGKKYTIQSD